MLIVILKSMPSCFKPSKLNKGIYVSVIASLEPLFFQHIVTFRVTNKGQVGVEDKRDIANSHSYLRIVGERIKEEGWKSVNIS